MNKILVTGATGRLGANLIRQLLERNYAVKALVIPDDPGSGGTQPIGGDYLNHLSTVATHPAANQPF